MQIQNYGKPLLISAKPNILTTGISFLKQLTLVKYPSLNILPYVQIEFSGHNVNYDGKYISKRCLRSTPWSLANSFSHRKGRKLGDLIPILHIYSNKCGNEDITLQELLIVILCAYHWWGRIMVLWKYSTPIDGNLLCYYEEYTPLFMCYYEEYTPPLWNEDFWFFPG